MLFKIQNHSSPARIFLQTLALLALLAMQAFSCSGGSGGVGSLGSPAAPAAPQAPAMPSSAAMDPADAGNPEPAPLAGPLGNPSDAAGGATVAAAGPQTPSFPVDVPVQDECIPYYQKYFYIREHGEGEWLAYCRSNEACWEREQSCRSDDRCSELPSAEEMDLAWQMRCQSDRRCRELIEKCRKIEVCQNLERECLAKAEQMNRWLRNHGSQSQGSSGSEQGGVSKPRALPFINSLPLKDDK